MRHLLAIAAVSVLAGAAASNDWPQFRGPGGDGVSLEKDLPLQWGKDKGIRYKVALPGRGLSNPVIASGRIYLTACSGYRERRLHVLCLEEATGKKLWERQFAATGSTSCHPMTNMASPTPVTDGKATALFATGDLAAIDREGNLLWYRSLVGDYPKITNQVGMASSPILAGDVLCVPMDNDGDSFAAGIDKKTGKNVWKVKRDRSINWVTPLAFDHGGKTAVLYQNDRGAWAYDAKTGTEVWGHKASTTTIPSPVKGDGVLFLTTGGDVIAVKPAPTEKDAKPLWSAKLLGGEYATPVYHDGKLYGVTAAAVICLDAKKGEELWRLRVDGKFDGSPVIANGHLYATNRKGRTYVVSLADKGKVVARNEIDDTIQASPAIANGCIYLRSDKYLYCVGAEKK